MEDLLKEMVPCYRPNQAELDLQLGLICMEVLDKLASRSFSKASWAKKILLKEVPKRS